MLVVTFCSVFLSLLAFLIPEARGHCRNLRFTSAPIYGHRLNDHVIRTIGVMNEDFCELQCYLEPNCVSYNFKNNGEHKCDLNNATYEHDNEHSGDLEENKNYVYRGAENACAKKPCQNNSTCQAGFTDRDYQCLCISGFTGHDCEIDTDECTDGTHNCDVNGAVCNNTPGSYNCSCKDGFVGDGINCADIDECANPTPPDCNVNAVCSNTQGFYVCTCKEGFYKDGQNCTEFVAGDCGSPMGMEDGKIPNSALKASSEWSPTFGPSKGRLNHHTAFITFSRRGQWIQVDFKQVAKVTKVGTQGGHYQHQWWVSRYTVSYSVNGGYFVNQLDKSSGVRREYTANEDGTNVVVNTLDEAIIARYVRIHPTAWHVYISMRLELYGCYSGFSTTKPPTCRASLGLENNEIPDSSITASSSYSYDYRASQGRLYQQGGWAAETNDAEQWFQVDFVNWTRVTGVAIQGSTYTYRYQRLTMWVTKFELFYSHDRMFFSDYREEGDNTKVFEGNTDHFLVVRHLLNNPINVTRYIRIYPVVWNRWISLGADFYGCKSVEIPETVCALPLGMENKTIPDSAIVASSRYDDDYGPERGRLNNKGGWISYYASEHQFLQIDLKNVTKVTRIATQGYHNWDWWTKTYTIDYSEDGGTFTPYRNGQVLRGNTDIGHTAGVILDPPIIARFIKINVKTYREYPSLRVELYGCSHGFSAPKPPVCLEALGMQNKQIPDAAITASTEDDFETKAYYGRLHLLRGSGRAGGWAAQSEDKDQFFQVHFGGWRKVTRVTIQGREDEDQWVEEFSLSYGYDSVFFQDYTEDDANKKVFSGNIDRYTPVSHDLKNPIITRYIRINPDDWKSRISMRAEFYGCGEGFEIPEIVCASPLGMEHKKIPDSAIVASSRYDEYWGPERGRLNEKTEGNLNGGWMSYNSDAKQFLQIDLENITKVTRIATQGTFDAHEWTETYTLDYSQDGVTFISYNSGQVLQGNTDKLRTAGLILDPPIIARFIKINVKTYKGSPSLRVELYGCSDGFPTPKPPVCLEALGMQNKKIPDSDITASSNWYGVTKAYYGRLHFLARSGHAAGGWASEWNDKDQFFQVHFGDWRKVTRVAIQGRQDSDQWVKSFRLSYGYDSASFQDYTEGEVKKVFPGNNDQYTPVSHDLTYPIITRYIRIHPESWHKHIAMRAEFYGCIKECQDALGMESRAITNVQITASSEHNAVHAAWHARLNFQEIPNQAAGAWAVNASDNNPWLQVDLGLRYTKVILTQVATQGRNSLNYSQWVTQYKLQYGDNGKAFQYYREKGQDTYKIFDGNTDQDTVVYHALNPPITARYIRFKPVDKYGHVSMRVELYGCLQGFDATFTSLGASGKDGPKSLGSHYTGQDHESQVTLSSGIQQWTVPYTGGYRIETVGAAGGYDIYDNSAQYRGRGARMVGTFKLLGGEIIQILVGQEGGIRHKDLSSSAGEFPVAVRGGGGGGGGTYVVRGGNTPLIVAGGGGGLRALTSRHQGCDANTSTSGNPGYNSWSGGSKGQGSISLPGKDKLSGGGGGFNSSGGNGTLDKDGEGGKGFLQGGAGGQSWDGHANGGFGGGGGGGRDGGGGGGYSGGSSGNNENDSCGGGGGSYNIGNDQQNDCCYNTAGHGKVIITLL